MKQYDYWFSWVYMEEDLYDMGNGFFALDHKITDEDLKVVAYWVKDKQRFNHEPVILSFHRIKKKDKEEREEE